jgi:conjugative relaxase-like TrwC/TraI family protein
MLRVTQQCSSAKAKEYYSVADYFTEGRELVGEWGGKGAQLLGLHGVVGQPEFEALCDNLHPTTRNSLTARTKQDRTVGYDFTWSVPKSVSVMYALTQDEELLGAFRGAVDETMRDVEAEMKTRVRRNGRAENRQTGNALWATFYHFTARPVDGVPDPQMHAHCFVFNSTFDTAEQRWKAGQFCDLKRDAPYWQAAFRVRLANRLQAQGYQLTPTRDDFELAGVPEGVIERFSRRTSLIRGMVPIVEEKLSKKYKKEVKLGPEGKAKLGETTREKKDTTLSWAELRSLWVSRLSDDERGVFDRIHARESRPVPTQSMAARAVDHTFLHCFETQSVVPEKELLGEALRYGLGAVTVEDVRAEFARRKPIVREIDGRRMVTTRDVVAEERQLVAFVRRGRGQCRPLGGFDRAITRPWLSEEQKRAVLHLWRSPDRVMIVRGAAGVGKTTLLQEAVAGIEAGGTPVVPLAPSAEASRGVLRTEGFQSADTVARFLVDEKLRERARGGVVLVDEASLVGTRSLARVFRHADELGARVILVGDVRQHAAVERGDALSLIERDGRIPVVSVTGIRRQEREEYRDAVKALSEGRILDGFDQLDRLKWVKELPDELRYAELAAHYVRAVNERKAGGEYKTALVVAPTHFEAAHATEAIRAALHQAQALWEEQTFDAWAPARLSEAERADSRNYQPGDMLQFHQNAPSHPSGSRLVLAPGQTVPTTAAARFQVFRPTSLVLAAGDRVRVTTGGKTKDGKHRLNTGALFTVAGFTDAGDIRLSNGWVVAKEFGHLTHGYCVTSHASQGKTVEHVLIAESTASLPAASRQQFYVSASRARESVTVYTDDKSALRDAVQRDATRPTATDLVRRGRRSLHPRLRQHLAFLQRMSTFARTHTDREPEPSRSERVLEATYER